MTRAEKIQTIEKAMGAPVLVLTRYSRPGHDARYAQVHDKKRRAEILFDAANDDDAVDGLLEFLRNDYPERFA